VNIGVQVEKLLFCAREMQLARLLAERGPNDYVRRAVARHVLVRARDLVAIAFDVLGALARQGAVVADVRDRVTAYRDAYSEYYETTRTRLSAHVQELEFSERLELWTDIEIIKLGYFVDGAREIYDALGTLSPPGYLSFTPFPDTVDPELVEALGDHATRQAPDGQVRVGSDVLAVSRPQTVASLNFTPVHRRAGELAAIDTWFEAEWGLLRVCASYINATRILKARIVTDIVSFADCLVTRTDGDPQHRVVGLDNILRASGDPAPIDEFRAVFRLAAALDPLRTVRNHVGAHLHRDDGMSVADLIVELDALSMRDFLTTYDRLRRVFHLTCRRNIFLTSYVTNGAVLAGVVAGRSPDSAHAFDETRPDSVPAPTMRARRYDADECREQLSIWSAGGPDALRARFYMWEAFMSSQLGPSGDEGSRRRRVAHIVFLEGLRRARSAEEAARLLSLVGECARGDPEPLAATLLDYYEATDHCARGPGSLRGVLRALGTLPINRGEWARAPLVAETAHADPLVATEAVVAIYRRLVEDQVFARSIPPGETMFSTGVAPLLATISPARRLLALITLASLFTAGQPMVLGDARTRELEAVRRALESAGHEALGAEHVASVQWTTLVQALDAVGLALFSSEALSPEWDDADDTARAFCLAALDGLVAISHVSPTPARCNLALTHLRVGDNEGAVRTVEQVFRADPACVEAHLLMIPVLVRAGVPRGRATRLLDELVATHVIDPRLQPALDAARTACA
jgi:hypothetical protein